VSAVVGSGAAEAALSAHLGAGATTVARAWAVTRRDGVTLGFTDHDLALQFEGIVFRPGGGMTAQALVQANGLSVDNSEALGVLSHAAIRAEDIEAGRYDGAEVRAWLVNWQVPEDRALDFAGTIGEIRRGDGGFAAELRGVTEALNQPQGAVYQATCPAVLGDGACGVDLEAPGRSVEMAAGGVTRGRVFRLPDLTGYAPGWFARGRVRVLSGAGAGLSGVVKVDRLEEDGLRRIELWQELRVDLAEGDVIRLEAGCDKSAGTCAVKFDNLLNFRGFPDIPGEDWLMSYPKRSQSQSGGSRRKTGTALVNFVTGLQGGEG
jgi:uncharacterized phage protein (TIGR02218 family)